jgi:hypothetical protein
VNPWDATWAARCGFFAYRQPTTHGSYRASIEKKTEALAAIDEFKQLAAAFGNVRREYDKHRRQKRLDDPFQFSIRMLSGGWLLAGHRHRQMDCSPLTATTKAIMPMPEAAGWRH